MRSFHSENSKTSSKLMQKILSSREIMPRFCLRKYFDSDSFELSFIDRHRVGLVIDSIEALSSNKYDLNIYLISKESPCQSTTQSKSNDGTIMQHNQKLTEINLNLIESYKIKYLNQSIKLRTQFKSDSYYLIELTPIQTTNSCVLEADGKNNKLEGKKCNKLISLVKVKNSNQMETNYDKISFKSCSADRKSFQDQLLSSYYDRDNVWNAYEYETINRLISDTFDVSQDLIDIQTAQLPFDYELTGKNNNKLKLSLSFVQSCTRFSKIILFIVVFVSLILTILICMQLYFYIELKVKLSKYLKFTILLRFMILALIISF